MSQGPAEAADLGVLSDLAPELASTFVSVASDIALVIGPDGVIRNVAQGDSPIFLQAAQWVGQRFVDTVSLDTRGKIQQLLEDVGANGVSRRREVNLHGGEGAEIPMAFAAIRLGQFGPVLAVGRDLRAIAAIQQRFVEAQQELERDYWRQRQAEARYRLLFQVATDAVLVVDGQTLQIIEANAAAHALRPAATSGGPARELAGQPLTVVVDPASRPAVDELLVTARTSGKPAEIRARLRAIGAGAAPQLVDISATPFRAQGGEGPQQLLLVRARRQDGPGGDNVRRLADYVEHTPDAVVITDSTGRVQMANPAFVLLCPADANESNIKGRPLADVLGDPSRRVAALVAEVRRNGIVAQSRAAVGNSLDGRSGLRVEISAALLEEGDQACLGFTLRRLAVGPERPLPQVDGLASALESLALQLGRVSLPELMQEATHLAERHLIRTALERSQGDQMLAADWLGVTPESLALRMQRHSLVSRVSNGSPPPSLLN